MAIVAASENIASRSVCKHVGVAADVVAGVFMVTVGLVAGETISDRGTCSSFVGPRASTPRDHGGAGACMVLVACIAVSIRIVTCHGRPQARVICNSWPSIFMTSGT